jgi:hypothetical protein
MVNVPVPDINLYKSMTISVAVIHETGIQTNFTQLNFLTGKNHNEIAKSEIREPSKISNVKNMFVISVKTKISTKYT